MNSILQVKNLNKTYKKKEKSVHAVKHISFEGFEGEILGILGPNGSGKTTTVKSIATIIDFNEGEIIVNGFNNKKHPSKARENIGAVLEGARNVYWRLTPVENMIYFAGLKGIGKKTICHNIDFFLETLDLKDVANKQLREFSKGMQQKVAVACAFITNPKVILLDEPTLGLDVETARTMKLWLKKMVKRKNHFTLVTSHDMKFIESVCDRVLIIKDGHIIASDTVKSLKKFFMKKVYRFIIEKPLSKIQKTELNALIHLREETSDEGYEYFMTFADDTQLYDIFAILSHEKQKILSIDILNDDFEDVFLEIMNQKGNEI